MFQNLSKYFVGIYFLCVFPLISSELPQENSIRVAVLDFPDGLTESPFNDRVEIYKSPKRPEITVDFSHGVETTSCIFHLEHNPNDPENVVVTDDIESFKDYVQKSEIPSSDLFLINWSKDPRISSVLSMDIPSPYETLKFVQTSIERLLCRKINEIEFLKHINKFKQFFDVYGQIFSSIPADHIYAHSIAQGINFLDSIKETDSSSRQYIEWQRKLNEIIETIPTDSALDYTKTNKIYKVKNSFLDFISEYPNTLVMWALGNDGKNVDLMPEFNILMENETIRSHFVFVVGTVPLDDLCTGRPERAEHSNYTEKFMEHVAFSPFYGHVVATCLPERERVAHGTSFAAPRVTAAAYGFAKTLKGLRRPFDFESVKKRLSKKFFKK